MTRCLPDPRMRCSGYWYARQAGMLPYGITGPDDLEFLRVLGARAAALARWYGEVPWRVQEGPWLVLMHAEAIWDEVATAMADEAAEHGTWNETAATTVVNVRTAACDVLIDRSTSWGNPFVPGRDGTREQVIAAYDRYLATRPDLLAALHLLRGKVLGCWCHPLPCHGDVLARRADALRMRRGG